MLIEVLYVPGCPNHAPAIEAIKGVLHEQSLAAEIHEIAVDDEATANALRFPGSPTIRINGVDSEPEPQSAFGLACRLYAGGTGVPSEGALKRAIDKAKLAEAAK